MSELVMRLRTLVRWLRAVGASDVSLFGHWCDFELDGRRFSIEYRDGEGRYGLHAISGDGGDYGLGPEFVGDFGELKARLRQVKAEGRA